MKIDHIKNRPVPPDVLPGGPVFESSLPEPNQIENVSAWQLDFRQLEPGAMQTHIRARQGQLVSLLEITMDRAVHQRGLAPPDTLTFGIPVSRSSLRWRDSDMGRKKFLTFGSGDGFEGLGDGHFHGLTFSVSNPVIETLADRIGLPIDRSMWTSGAFNPGDDHLGLSALTAKARNLLSPHCVRPMDVATEQDLLIAFLRVAARSDRLQDRSTGRQRARVRRIATEMMEARADENLPISDISAATGVSLRTLNRAFVEAFGIGPKAYYLRLRLNRLRRVLAGQPEQGLVSDAANALGFWHMGQLARDYRAQFGELPSQTVA